MINNTQYIYAVVNYDRGVVIHYACDALAALLVLQRWQVSVYGQDAKSTAYTVCP